MAAEKEGVFAKLANEVLQAAEHIVTRFDEGASALLHGKLPDGGANNGDSPDVSDDFDLHDENDPPFDEDMAGSPLEGIAESVLSDIIGGQVCIFLLSFFVGDNSVCGTSLVHYATRSLPFSRTGWPTNTNGTHSSLSCCNQLVRTLYSFVNGFPRGRLCLVYVGIQTVSLHCTPSCNHDYHWHSGEIRRTTQYICSTQLGTVCYTKLL